MLGLRGGVVVVVVQVAAGCGAGSDVAVPDSAGASPFVSGQRLRAKLLDGGMGAVQLDVWWDSELGVECRFFRAEDLRLRCLPGVSLQGVSAGRLVYTDDACTQPAHAVGVGSQPPPYVVGAIARDLECGVYGRRDAFTIHELGEPLTGVTAHYVPDSLTGACSAGFESSAYQYYALGARVDPSVFVRAIEVRVPRTESLDALVAVADDGASEIIGGFDLGRSDRCETNPFGRDEGPCLPSSLGFVSRYYADDACSQPIVVDFSPPDSACPRPPVAADLQLPIGLFEVGTRIASDAVYQYQYEPSDCIANPDPEQEGRRFFELGDPVPVASFPALVSARVGRGVLQVVHVADASGVPLHASYFADAATGNRCALLVTCDGQRRCLPSVETLAVNAYADAACTVPLAWRSCSQNGEGVISVTENVSCHEDANTSMGLLHELGQPHDGPLYGYDRTSGACVPQDLVDGACYYGLGELIDLDRFPIVADRIE